MKRGVSNIRCSCGCRPQELAVLLFISILLVFQGCAQKGKKPAGNTEELLGREVKEGKVIEGRIETETNYASRSAEQKLGYRVQLIASPLKEEAESVAELAKGLFTEKVYLEYMEPLYRIRIGDFVRKDEAEKIRDKALELGYENAWIVESPIEME
jgi:hypothetical protein